MTLDEQLRQALDGVAARLRDDLGRHLSDAAGDLTQSLEAAQHAAIESATQTAQQSAAIEIEEARASARREVDEARSQAAAELEQARAAAAREAEERLIERFESARVAAVAQAAMDATAAAERSAADQLKAAEQSLTERLTSAFHHERDALHAERSAAVNVAVTEAIAATEKSVTERLRAAFDGERVAAIALAVQETWAKAEQEHSEQASARVADVEARARTEVADAEGRARTEVAAAESKARAEIAQADPHLGARLLAVVQKIDEGQSLTDILGSLANGAAVEARRAGVFIVEGNGVRSWRLAGFGELDREGVIQPTESNGGIILDALRSEKVVRETEEADGRSAIAVPLVIAERVIAVLYADQGPAGQAGPQARPNWAASIEILGRHAGRALEAMTASRLAQAATGARPAGRAQTAVS